MKHFKRDLRLVERQSFKETTRVLRGDIVQSTDVLDTFFSRGHFYYQFRSPRLSRVMVCDNEGEFTWLAKQVGSGSPVAVLPCE